MKISKINSRLKIEAKFARVTTYRKLGAEANSKPKQARLRAKYDSKKSMELTCAIVFKDPISNISCTNSQEIITAAIGFDFHVPRVTIFKYLPDCYYKTVVHYC